MASIEVDRSLLQDLLNRAAPGHGLTLQDFAQRRVEREATLQTPLSRTQSRVAIGESAMTWLLLKDKNGEVPVEALAQWYGEERLPDGFQRPVRSIGFKETHHSADVIKAWLQRAGG